MYFVNIKARVGSQLDEHRLGNLSILYNSWAKVFCINGFLVSTCDFCAFLLMKSRLCRLVRINPVILKDTAFISIQSHFNHDWVISVPKVPTDRWTDGFSALYELLVTAFYVWHSTSVFSVGNFVSLESTTSC